MARLLVDEDLPRSLAAELRARGHDACHVRDRGLRGRSDDDILAAAVAEDRAVVTADVGFASLLRYPLGTHAGIVVARFPSWIPNAVVAAAVLGALAEAGDDLGAGILIVVEPDRIRVRRAPPGVLA